MKKIIKNVLLVATVFSFMGCNPNTNQYLGNLNISYDVYVNEEVMDSNELGFYYGYSLIRFINQYYNAFDNDGLDMVGFEMDEDINSLQNQQCTIEGFTDKTWEYYFVVKATELYHEIEALYNAAIQNGYTISNEDTQIAEEVYQDIVNYCDSNGIDVTDYLHSTFGSNMTKQQLITNYEKIELAGRYAETLWIEPTDEQIEFYYDLYKDDIDTVTIRYFAFDKDQLEQAEAFKDAVTNEEDFKQLALTYSEESMKEHYSNDDLSLRSYLRKEDLPEHLQEALFSEDLEGTTMVVEGMTSYDVVMLVSREKPTYHQAQVSTIYLDAREYNTDTVTPEKLQLSKDYAEELLAVFKAEDDPSLALFHQYNQAYSDDKNNQGDYDFVSRGDSSKEIEHWLFEEDRQPGDTIVLPSTYGHTILYFRGYGEVDYYQRSKQLAKEMIYEENIQSLKNQYRITIEKK